MKKSKFMILGGGMVAGYAAKELAARGLKAGELSIVSADSSVPYERPPLSKSFLAGKDTEESIRINPENFYGEHGIELKLQSEVRGVDAARKTIHFASGETCEFEKLIVATGAVVRKLNIPGAELEGVHYLRSMEDSKRIRTHAENARSAVVIGSGFIGMEAAAVLAQKGVSTTMILREDRVWKQFFTPAMSQFFEKYYVQRGVKFARQTNVAAIEGSGGPTAVRLDGDRKIASDLVVAGIGVTPAVAPFTQSGLQIANGVLVNEYLETSHPGIYAAGDVANYQDTIFDKRRRVEHWDNAVSQGQYCARALTGERTPFSHVPYFFSDVFDLSYEFWGDTSLADQVVERGDVTSTSFSVWWLNHGRVVAAFAMNRPDEEREAAPRWIASRQAVSPDKLKRAESVSELTPEHAVS